MHESGLAKITNIVLHAGSLFRIIHRRPFFALACLYHGIRLPLDILTLYRLGIPLPRPRPPSALCAAPGGSGLFGACGCCDS